jgi:hypothetical protein
MLACLVDPRLAVSHLAADRAGEHVGGDEGAAPVMMRQRLAARRVVHDDGNEALARKVRYRLAEGRRDRLT